MAKSSSSGNPLPRVFLFLLLIGAVGYYLYSHPSLLDHPQIKTLTGSVKGATSSINTEKIKTTLVDPPQILSTTQSIAVDTGIIKENEKINELADDIVQKVKDLPKDQAAAIVKNTCQQIIDNIDSSY